MEYFFFPFFLIIIVIIIGILFVLCLQCSFCCCLNACLYCGWNLMGVVSNVFRICGFCSLLPRRPVQYVATQIRHVSQVHLAGLCFAKAPTKRNQNLRLARFAARATEMFSMFPFIALRFGVFLSCCWGCYGCVKGGVIKKRGKKHTERCFWFRYQ